jgi:hypothetical protein
MRRGCKRSGRETKRSCRRREKGRNKEPMSCSLDRSRLNRRSMRRKRRRGCRLREKQTKLGRSRKSSTDWSRRRLSTRG